jgi:PAS domain S-box-containing protein
VLRYWSLYSRDVNEWNSKTAEITGYSKEEAFDCNLVENFIVPHMRSSVQDILENALQGRGTSNFELEFRTKSGEIRHLLVNATTRRDASNVVVGVVCGKLFIVLSLEHPPTRLTVV